MNYKEERIITDLIKNHSAFEIDVRSFRNYDDDLCKAYDDYKGSDSFEIEINEESYLEFTIEATGMEDFFVSELNLFLNEKNIDLDEKTFNKFCNAIIKQTQASSDSF